MEWFHPSGIASLACDNFGSALDHMARYKQLTCPEAIDSVIHGDEWTIRFRWLQTVENEPPALIDYCFGWMQTIGRQGSGTNVSPVRVEYVQPRSYLQQIERHFNCKVVTGAAQNAIIFRASDARLPFITRNAELLDMLAPQLNLELKQSQAQDSFIEQVRSSIQQRLTGQRPSVDEVARDLHMSSRTLQRRLQETETSFQRELDEARRQMARYYLRNSILELNEAAYLLGYEDSNSFVRAFRGWEGIPPGQWRETYGETAANLRAPSPEAAAAN
jgi:AraC-like DNA-binding protein